MIQGSLFGSCRYQGVFSHCFPPRLYSLREVQFFLAKRQLYSSFFDQRLNELGVLGDVMNVLLGDSCHRQVAQKTSEFFDNSAEFFANRNFFIEVSSLMFLTRKGCIASHFFGESRAEVLRPQYFKALGMTRHGVCSSLLEILQILQCESSEPITLFVIPHADLSISKENPSRIPQRVALSAVLEEGVRDLGMNQIVYLDVWQSLRRIGVTLEDIFRDGHHLSSRGYSLVLDEVNSLLQRRRGEERESLFGSVLSCNADGRSTRPNSDDACATSVQISPAPRALAEEVVDIQRTSVVNLYERLSGLSQGHGGNARSNALLGPELAQGRDYLLSKAYKSYPSAGVVVEDSKFFFHTDLQDQPSIAIDLGCPREMACMVIRNRTDGFQDRAKSLFYVVHDEEKYLVRDAVPVAVPDEFLMSDGPDSVTPLFGKKGRYLTVFSPARTALHFSFIKLY